MRLLGLLALPALALAVSACGDSSGVVSLDPVAKAAEKTQSQGSETVSLTISSPAGISGSGHGVVNNGKGGSGRMTLEMHAKGQTIRFDEVNDGLTLYMRSPVFTKDPSWPKGKTWMKLDLEEALGKNGIDLGSLGDSSPSSSLGFLKGSDGKPQQVGKERVAGVMTTHYRATVDLGKAASQSSGDEAKSLQKMADLMKKTGNKTMTVDAWIDATGLLRKESYEQRFSKDAPAIRSTVVIEKVGPAVHIDVPSGDDVFDATDMAAQGLSSGGG